MAFPLGPTVTSPLRSGEQIFLSKQKTALSLSHCTNQKQKTLRVESQETGALTVLKSPCPTASLPRGILDTQCSSSRVMSGCQGANLKLPPKAGGALPVLSIMFLLLPPTAEALPQVLDAQSSTRTCPSEATTQTFHPIFSTYRFRNFTPQCLVLCDPRKADKVIHNHTMMVHNPTVPLGKVDCRGHSSGFGLSPITWYLVP